MAYSKTSGRRWLKWLAGTLAVLVVLIVAALVVAPMFIPVETIRQQVTSAVKDATGRDLEIKGKLSVSAFPTLAVEADDVTFANAPWATGGPMASLAKLDLHLRLLPLLSHRIEVSSFVLEKPVIDLETDKSGHGNWEFGGPAPVSAASPATPTPAVPAPSAAPASSAGGNVSKSGGGLGVGGIALGDVHIDGGHITYRDGQTGKTETIDAINVKLTLANLDSPLALDGSAQWHGKPVQLQVGAQEPRALLQGPGSPISLKLDADTLKLAFDGTLTVAGPPKGTGMVDIATPSIRNLMTWATGQPATMPGDGLGPFSLKGKVTVDGAKYGLGGVQLGLDGMKGTGDLAVDTGGARPSLKGSLAVDTLDLNHYMAQEKDNQKGGGEKAAANSSSTGGGVAKGGAAASAQQGWDDTPIDASGLKAADINLALAADAIHWRKVQVGKTAVQITLDAGRLTLGLTDMALYQGDVKGAVQVDGSNAVLATTANLKIDKVQVGPLLKVLADNDRVTGAAVVQTQLTSRGKSQKDLVGALNGKGSLALQNGVVKGIDLVGLVKNAASAVVGGNGGETDFTTASGTYTIANGVLINKDLNVSAPTLSTTGAGTVDLPARTVDYKLSTKLVSTLAVPVDVKGPWDHISWGVDLAGMATQNIGNAANLVGSGAKGAGGLAGSAAGGAGRALKKLFGN